jgi:PAS domain S-box-containing protein
MYPPDGPGPDDPAALTGHLDPTEDAVEYPVRRTPLRVLIIEDSEDDTALLIRALRRGGYDPTYVRVDTAAAMLSALVEHTWDLIVSDYVMPHFSAPHALSLLREQGIDLPVIILSGQIGEDVAVASIKAGANDYLMKPNLSRLQPAIERALREVRERGERERAQKALSESEASFRLLFASNPHPMWVYDARTLRFMEVNAAAVAHYGYTRDEFLSMRLTDIRPPADVPGLLTEIENHRTDLHAARVWRHRLKDGQIRDVEITSHTLEFAGHRAVLVVAQDITERKRAEQALTESREYSRLILDTANDAFVSINADGLITAWNRQAELTFGWPRDEIMGQSMREVIIPPRYREAHQRGLQHFLATGSGTALYKRIDLTALHRDGHEFPVELTIWPTRVGDTFYFHAFIRDTTERKRTEEALRRAYDELEVRVQERTEELATANAALQTTVNDLHQAGRERVELLAREQEARRRVEESNRALERATQAKSEFLAAMSHELRTPLNSIIGFSELLLDDMVGPSGSPEHHRYATHIHQSGKHLLSLVNDILDLSKVEAGRMELRPETFDAKTSLLAVDGAIRPLAEKKGLTLVNSVPREPIALYADQGKFTQVLYNLLSNAVKFTPEGGRVEMAARLISGALEVSVVDTGVGIAAQDQERIFEPFEQLEASTTRQHAGTGLGLALARRLAQLQGGRLWVESAPGQGSRFAFTVPMSTAAGGQSRNSVEASPTGMR